jgi:hypothetical protein
MLHPVEFLPLNARRTLRRAVKIEAEIIASEWETPRCHRVIDLSHEGLRVAAGTLLPVGQDVVVSFTPPGWWPHGELIEFARVRRGKRRKDGRAAQMGLSFVGLSLGLRRELERTLRHRPPPLPESRWEPKQELVWMETLVTWTEDLGDRVNTFEVSDAMRTLDENEFAPRAIGDLVTGGVRRNWYCAA